MTYANASLLRSSLSIGFAGLLAGLAVAACDLPDKNLGDDAGDDAPSTTTDSACEQGEEPADCNTCSCVGGQWVCTDIACVDTDTTAGTDSGLDTDSGTDTGPGSVDSDGGNACDPREDPSDECNACACVDGQWTCAPIACDDSGGTTSDDGGPGCDPAGDVSDGCVTCECLDGEWLCTDPSCSHVVELCQGTEPTDVVWVTDAAIVGDTLEITVEHGGGCGSHEYGSCWDGSFAESNPVQAYLQVDHLDLGDPCDAIVSQSLVISLVPMRDAWIDAYQQASGTIIVHVADWGALDYTF